MPLLLPSLAWVCGLVFIYSDIPYIYGLVVLLLLLWHRTIVFFFIVGLSYASVMLAWQQHQFVVDSSWLNQRVNIQATIDEVRQTPQYTRLRLSHVQRDDGQGLAAKVDVYVYQYQQNLKPDMQVSLSAKLHPPRNKKNPAYFDYEQYMFHQGVVLVGSTSNIDVRNKSISWLEQGRQTIRSVLQSLEQDKQGVLLALLLADRSQIPLAIDDAFAASGATHLLAISGLHMGLVAAWGFMLMWWLITRREAWIVRFPVRLIALSSGLLLAFAYALLADFPIPAQRAFLMLLAGVLAWMIRAKSSPLNTMFAALILITLFDPASVLSISLWLSFVATSALLIWAKSMPKVESIYAKAWLWLKAVFWVSIIASLATLPLIAYVFERLPAWSLFANILLVPLYALWVLPLALLGELFALLGGSTWAVHVFEWSGFGIGLGNQILIGIHNLPAGSLWLRGDLPWMFIVLAVCLVGAGFLWLRQQRWLAGFTLALSLLLFASVMTSERNVERSDLYVWDVGQGASALLSLPSFSLVVDVPGKRGSKFNGGTIAAQNMRHLGLLHADAVVLSHAQSDHAGGFERLMASLNDVGEIWLADIPENHVYFQHLQQYQNIRWLKQGDAFKITGALVQVLWPPQGLVVNNSNNASLVLNITLNTGQHLLFAGDMEAPVEASIAHEVQNVDVMLMPHHGSKTSSTRQFVKKVRPKTVIAQTGYKNHYGFPKEEVVKRYKHVGAKVLNTADGYVRIQLDKM